MNKKNYGTWGYSAFDSNRKEIINKFNEAKSKNEQRPVRTAHGNVFETYVKNWLENYLPDKYGVTSGYIAPDDFDLNSKIYHYDLIIYDKHEAPTLWIEKDGEADIRRAIPSDNVYAVFELKSSFTANDINNAIDKLNDLDKYTFNDTFFTGIIFAEIAKVPVLYNKILKNFDKIERKDRFWNSIILCNNIDDATGILSFSSRLEESCSLPLVKAIDEIEIKFDKNRNLTMKNQGEGARLTAISHSNWAVIKTYFSWTNIGENSVELIWANDNFIKYSIELLLKLSGKQVSHIDDSPRYCRVFDYIEEE